MGIDCKERHTARGPQSREQKNNLLCKPLVAAGLSRGDIFLTWGSKGQGVGVCRRLFIYLVGWAVMGDLGSF